MGREILKEAQLGAWAGGGDWEDSELKVGFLWDSGTKSLRWRERTWDGREEPLWTESGDSLGEGSGTAWRESSQDPWMGAGAALLVQG